MGVYLFDNEGECYGQVFGAAGLSDALASAKEKGYSATVSFLESCECPTEESVSSVRNEIIDDPSFDKLSSALVEGGAPWTLGDDQIDPDKAEQEADDPKGERKLTDEEADADCEAAKEFLAGEDQQP